MAESGKIESLEGLESWLISEFETLDFAKCICVALRAALRDFPPRNLMANRDVSQIHLLPSAHLLLQSIVSTRDLCEETRAALARSMVAIGQNNLMMEETPAHLSAIAVCNRSSHTAWRVVEATASSHASAASQAQIMFAKSPNDYHSQHAYDEAQRLVLEASLTDLNSHIGDIFTAKLWGNEAGLVASANERPIFDEYYSGSSFSFWRDWYHGFLDGKPLDWELQRRVALIDDAIWNAGPEAVAKEIEHIKAKFLAEKLPLAETIALNPDTGKFHVTPVPVQNAPLMSALLTQISDGLEDAMTGHNGLSEHSGDVRKITRVVTRYGNDPQQAELTLTTVAKSLRRQIHDSHELPDSSDNLALLDAVEEGVRGIRANHPDVAANRDQLAQQAVLGLEPEEKQTLEQALPVLKSLSEGALFVDFAEDIPDLINDTVLPLPDGAPPLPPADAATRVFSRVSTMAVIAEKGASILDSKEIKTARLAHLGYTCLELLYALVQIGLRIFGVL